MAQIKAKKKSTFFISEDLLSEMKETVSRMGLRSQNALVEEALREYLSRARQELRRRQYIEASRDPLVLADIEEVRRDFQHADAESARMIK